MAGNYPDVPGHRFVYDRDGTQVYLINAASIVTQLTGTQVNNLNDEDADSLNTEGGPSSLLFYFPEQRVLSGVFVGGVLETNALISYEVLVSSDTTNGVDGSWTSLLTMNSYSVILPNYRDSITPLAASNVKAVRLYRPATALRAYPSCIHFYGSIPTTGSPNRLVIWHPTLDEPIGGVYFDWGDSPRSSSADRTFRVKNLSASLTANDITLSFDALTDGSPSVAGMHLVSDDGTTFAATETIPSLGPGVISSVMTMRRVLASNAPLGLWAPRIHAVADSWS